MRNRLAHWSLLSLVFVWALSHASVFGQQNQSAADKIRQGLNRTITIDYSGQSLAEVLAHIREKTALPISVDQFSLQQTGINVDDNAGQFRVQGTNKKVDVILRRMLNNAGLTYILFEDGILITTEEMAVARQMSQRVSVDLEDVPFKKAARDMAKNHGVNLVLDPRVAKQTEATVSLQLESASFETALRLLAELANLKAVRMGNVLFVTSEERAKKIRDEEPFFMDNPNKANSYRLRPPPFPGGFAPGGGVFPGGGFVPGGGPFMPGRGVAPLPAEKIAPPPGVDQPPLPEVKKIDGDGDPASPKNKPRLQPNVPAHVDPIPPPVIRLNDGTTITPAPRVVLPPK